MVSLKTTGKTLDKLLSNGICVFIQLNGKTDFPVVLKRNLLTTPKRKLLGHCHLNDEVVVPVAVEKIIVLIQTQPHL